jgi:hypothetical protein
VDPKQLVLHCFPGPLSCKERAISNIAGVVADGGVVFGASVLGTSERHTSMARAALRQPNREGTFDNLTDTAGGLRDVLERHLDSVEFEVVGSIAIFAGHRPPKAPG